MASASLVIYPNNDLVLTINLREPINGDALNGASVTYELKDAAGSLIDSGSMLYIEQNSDGYYVFRETLVNTLPLSVDDVVSLSITADAGPGKHNEWEPDVVVQKRVA